MKALHIFTILLLFTGSLSAKTPSLTDEAAAYDALFEVINEKRFGLTEASIRATKDPFIKVYPDSVLAQEGATKKEIYRLHAIFDNRVKINNIWLTQGDMIGTYRLSAVGTKDATLVNASQTLKLTLSDKGTNNVVVSFK